MSQTPNVETQFTFFVTLRPDTLDVLARKSVHNVYKAPDGSTMRCLHSREERNFSYPLTEISLNELKRFRKEKVPSFVLKVDDKFWHARIPKYVSFGYSNILGNHLCCTNGHTLCKRLSSASDERGGCAKVRAHSKGIEDFPWIKSGYETFGMIPNNNVFVVVACEHYEETEDKPRIRNAKEKISILEDLNSWDHDLDFFAPSFHRRSNRRSGRRSSEE